MKNQRTAERTVLIPETDFDALRGTKMLEAKRHRLSQWMFEGEDDAGDLIGAMQFNGETHRHKIWRRLKDDLTVVKSWRKRNIWPVHEIA